MEANLLFRKRRIDMAKVCMKDPITQRELPVIMERGKPRAVVIDIEIFDILIKLLQTVNEEDIREAVLLGQSPVAKRAINEGIATIKQGKIRPWRRSFEEI